MNWLFVLMFRCYSTIAKLYGIASWYYYNKILSIPTFLIKSKHIEFSCFLPYQGLLRNKVKLGYDGLGVVINKKTKIGDNWLTGTCVTIGDNVVVGANSIVVKYVLSNYVLAFVSTKRIKESINMHDYI